MAVESAAHGLKFGNFWSETRAPFPAVGRSADWAERAAWAALVAWRLEEGRCCNHRRRHRTLCGRDGRTYPTSPWSFSFVTSHPAEVEDFRFGPRDKEQQRGAVIFPSGVGCKVPARFSGRCFLFRRLLPTPMPTKGWQRRKQTAGFLLWRRWRWPWWSRDRTEVTIVGFDTFISCRQLQGPAEKNEDTRFVRRRLSGKNEQQKTLNRFEWVRIKVSVPWCG